MKKLYLLSSFEIRFPQLLLQSRLLAHLPSKPKEWQFNSSPIRSLTLCLPNMHMLLLQMEKRHCCGGSTLRPGVRPSDPKPPDLSLI
ncbi:hypothetical protein E1A91_A05G397000v1 [Gossypium mustelinum]|uniref:Uncharacterized protein n=3 Tax=Gossypium TaxID=3633 RepID=A0A5D2ZF78_GOSMU|nr:hypothetical protein ES288_A05G410200v1 [Gossypium darwinii]TYI30796.1 hypothetical protein ES332_A05G412400v1 [Gossypium tomentosum]TYJ37746.1 hypothetical protein E1A91_A05G397000v1 [Gossypium mustelinum]TYH20176.1 hypothetical protein ES288_A05G410200v1 [Gossypium darwinii]TYI30797.1 hypothetical protein ES332_A05G412400v1 [Gossypium tomentosum]